MNAKTRFEVSIIITLVLTLVIFFSSLLTFLVSHENDLLDFFEKQPLFVSNKQVEKSDIMIDHTSVSNFYTDGIMGKWVVIDGRVLECGLSIGHRPYLGLGIDKYEALGCFFDVEHSDYILNKIQQGSQIKIRGQFKGKMYGNLIFSNCSIIR